MAKEAIRRAEGYRVTQKCGHEAFTFNRNNANELVKHPCPNCYEQEHDGEAWRYLARDCYWQITE
jgi:hypothetical protein